jgi:hypothetical protein
LEVEPVDHLHGLLPGPFKAEQPTLAANDKRREFDGIAQIHCRLLLDVGRAGNVRSQEQELYGVNHLQDGRSPE